VRVASWLAERKGREMAKVMLTVEVDETMVKKLTMDDWSRKLECAFSNWDEVYQTIAQEYMGSGDYYEFCTQKGWLVS
jgi:hypothetical protein